MSRAPLNAWMTDGARSEVVAHKALSDVLLQGFNIGQTLDQRGKCTAVYSQNISEVTLAEVVTFDWYAKKKSNRSASLGCEQLPKLQCVARYAI